MDGFPLSKVDENENNEIHEVSNTFSNGSPMFVVPLSDVIVREGDPVILQPFLTSPSPLTGTWRGPAVEAGRAKIESDGTTTRLVISACCRLDAGPYSLVVENSCGVTSTVARVDVVCRPGPPVDVTYERIGCNAIKLKWSCAIHNGSYFSIEYKRADMTTFRSAAVGLQSMRVILRHFRPAVYHIRVFSYNLHFRSDPSKELIVDFQQKQCILDNLSALYSSFIMGGVCGNGRFSTVFFVESIKTGKILVAKLFSEERSTEDIEREVTILSEMNHSNLPRYKGTFTSETGLIVVMKQANGVAITNFIDHLSISLDNMVNKSSVLSEDILRRLSREIISAVEYLHAKNIMHLDIRPENLLVDDHVTLIDFGCAQFCNEAQLSWGDGDESYSAPERFSGLPPTIKSDIWSFGAVLYVLCFGDLPHHTTTDNPRVECSLALINILCQTLVQDSNRRLSAEQCLKHPWISGITGDNTCSNAAL